MRYIRNDKFLKSFGSRIKQLRTEASLGQEDLAVKCDIDVRQIGRIERGEINTGVSTIYSLSKALNISLKNLFDFDIEENQQ